MTNHIIVGTAGHVDHGKTSLIKALTEIETDRLGEEKKRGITIELGFAFMDTEDGDRIGIIDVPGHEKFIRHMLSGAGGIDLALLVVDANEGVMPQTKEHIYILDFLGIEKAIIAITKTDTVDKEWLEIVKDDIRAFGQGSFLENAPIFPVSSKTGEGIKELKAEIIKESKEIKEKDLSKPSRLFVDRVFSLKGAGTVITGTLFDGQISLGDDLSLYPDNHPCKVRNLQVHGKDVEKAQAGQRLAVNLTGVRKEDIERGFVLAEADSLILTDSVYLNLKMVADTKRVLKHGAPVHFHTGSTSEIGHIYFFDRKELAKKEEAFCQIKFEDNLALKFKDRFVLRYFSPLDTIGGGEIIGLKTSKAKDKDILDKLKILKDGDYKDKLRLLVDEFSQDFKDLDFYYKLLDLNRKDFDKLKDSLDFIIINGKYPISDKNYQKIQEKTLDILEKYHQENPLKNGMGQAELHQRILSRLEDESIAQGLMDLYIGEGLIKRQEGFYSLKDFVNLMDDSQIEKANEIKDHLYKELVASKKDLIEEFGQDKGQLIEALIREGDLIVLDQQNLIEKTRYEEVLRDLVDYIDKNEKISLADFRDLTKSSRRVALSILDYLDKNRITVMVEDHRFLHPRYKSQLGEKV